jgi:predicted regulator of Ras-like GTPase activity (Roadblock/LC7/MglB family)
MKKLDEILQKFRMEVGPVFIAVDVVGPDGISIAGETVIPNFDNTVGAARGTMAMTLAKQVCEKLQLGPMEEFMFTSEMGFFVSTDLGNTYSFMVGVAKQATLGMLRVLIKDYSQQIVDAIPR